MTASDGGARHVAGPDTGRGGDAAGLALIDLRALADALETLARAIEDNPSAFIAGEHRREVEIAP